mmetsp:Transcript_14990/g.27072  ORF Transcript_14990/g.27072 Transcript_14990/m.27072 type:complete len:301 (+) Transcript_14990:567-1469(+)
MLCHILHNTILLNQLDRKTFRISIAAMQLNIQSITLGMPCAKHLIQHILCHLTPRRPLTTSNKRHARLGIFGDDVITRHLSARGQVRIGRQGTPSTPGAQDIRSADLHVLAEVLLAFLEHPLDLLLRRVRQSLGGTLLVRGAHDDTSLPREEEEESTIGGVVIQQSHVVWGVVSGQDDVRPRCSSYGRFDRRIVLGLLLAQCISERTSCEDYIVCVNFHGVTSDTIQRLDTRDFPSLVKNTFRHFNIVGNIRPFRRGSHGNRHVRPGIIMLPLVKYRTILDFLLVQLWKLFLSFLRPHDE